MISQTQKAKFNLRKFPDGTIKELAVKTPTHHSGVPHYHNAFAPYGSVYYETEKKGNFGLYRKNKSIVTNKGQVSKKLVAMLPVSPTPEKDKTIFQIFSDGTIGLLSKNSAGYVDPLLNTFPEKKLPEYNSDVYGSITKADGYITFDNATKTFPYFMFICLTSQHMLLRSVKGKSPFILEQEKKDVLDMDLRRNADGSHSILYIRLNEHDEQHNDLVYASFNEINPALMLRGLHTVDKSATNVILGDTNAYYTSGTSVYFAPLLPDYTKPPADDVEIKTGVALIDLGGDEKPSDYGPIGPGFSDDPNYGGLPVFPSTTPSAPPMGPQTASEFERGNRSYAALPRTQERTDARGVPHYSEIPPRPGPSAPPMGEDTRALYDEIAKEVWGDGQQ